MDVRIHRLAPADGVACEQEEPAEGFDLVELEAVVWAADLDPVFLDQKRDEVSAVVFSVALNAADFVKERQQNTGVRVSHAGECIAFVALHIVRDRLMAVFKRPFVHAIFGIMDVAIKEFTLIRIIHNLANGRAGTFRDNPIHNAFAFRHPNAGKTHNLKTPHCGNSAAPLLTA